VSLCRNPLYNLNLLNVDNKFGVSDLAKVIQLFLVSSISVLLLHTTLLEASSTQTVQLVAQTTSEQTEDPFSGVWVSQISHRDSDTRLEINPPLSGTYTGRFEFKGEFECSNSVTGQLDSKGRLHMSLVDGDCFGNGWAQAKGSSGNQLRGNFSLNTHTRFLKWRRVK
jgi:hypothetical protein